MKVIAFNGSARKNGNTAILLKTALAELERADIQTELVQLAGLTLSGCDACYTCRDRKDKRCVIETDPVNEYVEKVLAADGILLGSPVYFGDITTNMKALMERGREKGFLTYDEVNDALPTDIVSSDQIDDVMSMFGEHDIEVVDDAKKMKLPDKPPPEPETKAADPEEREEEEPGGPHVSLSPGI